MRDGSAEMIVERKKLLMEQCGSTSVWTVLGVERKSLQRRRDYRS